jgi:hypothetical protein
LGGAQIAVACEALDLADVEAGLQEVGAERVAEDVGVGGRIDAGLACDSRERATGLEAIEVEDRLLRGCGGCELGEAVGELLIVDVKDGAVVASFAADADLGLACALARGDVDRADAERFADPKAAQEQQRDERPSVLCGQSSAELRSACAWSPSRPRCASSFSTVGRRTPRSGVRCTSSCSRCARDRLQPVIADGAPPG